MRKASMLVLLWACGDDGAPAASGVDAKAAIEQLPEAELKTICRWISDMEYARDGSQDCVAIGVNRAWEDDLDRDGCERERQACLASSSAIREQLRTESLARCANDTLAPRAYCTATVGELERCYRDTIEKRDRYVAQFRSCAAVDTFTGMPDLYPPASCEGVQYVCYPVETDPNAPP